MNIIARLFWLPFNERTVDDAVLPSLAKTLGSFVKARGLAHVQLSDELLHELLAEAIERAGTMESSGKLRYRVLWQKIEEVADAAARVLKGHEDSDSKVASILKEHRSTSLERMGRV